VGDFKAPPVSVKGFEFKDVLDCATSVHISFEVNLDGDVSFVWETMLVGRKLFVEVPKFILPNSSKESFITLLEYAESVLKCSHVIICFKKDRPDRASLIRVFMFLGFVLLPPGHNLVPAASGSILYLAYAIEDDGDGGGECDRGDN
jgi:ornithine decarboxylase antizyme 1